VQLEKEEIELERMKAGYPQLRELLNDMSGKMKQFVNAVIVERTETKDGKSVRVLALDPEALDEVAKNYVETTAPVFGVPKEKALDIVRQQIKLFAQAEIAARQQQPPRVVGKGVDPQGRVFVIYSGQSGSPWAEIVRGVRARVPGEGGAIPKEAFVALSVGDKPRRLAQQVFSQNPGPRGVAVPHPLDPSRTCVLKQDKDVKYVFCPGLPSLNEYEYERLVEQRLRKEAGLEYEKKRFGKVVGGGGESDLNNEDMEE
jgi:hypothetical protein